MAVKATFIGIVTVVLAIVVVQPCKAAHCDTQKDIIVSNVGIDNEACLIGNKLTECHTLEFVLLNSTSLDCTKINVTYNQEIKSTIEIKPNVSGLTIVGSTSVADETAQVTCNKPPDAGFFFVEAEDIQLVNITWNACSLKYIDDGKSLIAGIFFRNSRNINITGCQFISSLGNGLFLRDVGGTVMVKNTNFTENGNQICWIDDSCKGSGLRIEFSYCGRGSDLDCERLTNFKSYANYMIENCSFTLNKNDHINSSYTTPEGRGAGLKIYLGGGSAYNIFVIKNSVFSENHAFGNGSGLSVEIFGPNSTSNVISVMNTIFYKNTADVIGGGVYSRMLSPQHENDPTLSNNTLVITDSKFVLNEASQSTGVGGGGLVFFTNSIRNKVNFTNNDWKNNTASQIGSAVALQLHYSGMDASSEFIVNFHSCNFSMNKLMNSFYNDIPMGTMYAENITVNFTGLTIFRDNVGSALALNFTTAHIYGNATFDRNSGVNGGAVVLIHMSWITITEYCTMNFTNNYALFLGGAIDSHLASACVFKYFNGSWDVRKWRANISFISNTARTYDNAIFVGQPRACSNFLEYPGVFSYFPNSADAQVVSGPAKILFSNQTTLRVRLGEYFKILPKAIDSDSHPTFAYGQVLLNTTLQHCSPYRLHGPGFVVMNENSEFYISGPAKPIVLGLLFVIRGTNLQNVTPLEILEGCNPGYKYDGEMCMPSLQNSTNLYYPPGNRVACIRYGYWYGNVNGTTVVALCPSKFCSYQNGRCPTGPSEDCNRPGFCLLSDEQCNEGRAGVLCSSCKTNHSFTLDTSQCVNSCPTKYVVLVVVLIAAYWLLFVIFLLIVLKCSVGTGTGYVFVILYYFSVLQISIHENWPSKPLRMVAKFFIGFTQFSPQMLGEWNHACFGENWNSLNYELFNYTTSIVVSIIIASTVFVARYCRCPRAISPATNSPIRMFCILILLSYTSLTESSFQILKVTKFSDIDHLYVSIKPDLIYMRSQHIVYAFIALCVEFFILLPLSILIVFAPYLEKKLNYVKLRIKPIVDELQASYRSQCRWFAGFYLICRQLLYLSTWIPNAVVMSYVMIIFHTLIFVIHVAFLPYKDTCKWLNKIDTLFLLDLVLLSALSSPTSAFAPAIPGAAKFHEALIYVLILFPCAYTLTMIVILVVNWCKSYRKKRISSHSNGSNDSNVIIAYSCDREQSTQKVKKLNHSDSGSSPEQDSLLS